MLCNFNKVKHLGKVSFLYVCRYIRSTEDLQNQLCIIFCVSFCEANVVLEDTKYSEYSYSTNVHMYQKLVHLFHPATRLSQTCSTGSVRIKQQVAVFHTVRTGELLHLLKHFYFMVSKKTNKTNKLHYRFLFIY